MAFVIHLPFVIHCLQTVFWKVKICFFFCSSWKYLILFIVLDCIFLHARCQICCYLWGPRGSGAVNLTQPTNVIPNKYIYDAFLVIYLSILLLLFFKVLVLQSVGTKLKESIFKNNNQIKSTVAARTQVLSTERARVWPITGLASGCKNDGGPRLFE